MSEYENLLINVYCHGSEQVLRCAVKVRMNLIPDNAVKYWNEPTNREFFANILPEHVCNAGPVVGVEELFEIHEYQQ